MRSANKFKFYDKKRQWRMDVLAIDWEKGIVVGLYGGQHWISLIEHGDLMQYTGLKDKYRKEIYEKSDVLSCKAKSGFEHRDTIELGWSNKDEYGYIWSTSRNIVSKQDFLSERYEIIGT